MRIDDPYKYSVDIKDITYEQFCEIETWCIKAFSSHHSDYQDWGEIMDTWWTFPTLDEAEFFKRKWK